MPGWDSPETVAAMQSGLQIVGLALIVIIATLAAFAAYQLRAGQWPEWFDIGQYQLRRRVFEIACAVFLAVLLVTEAVAYGYGLRQRTLAAEAEQANAERIKVLVAEAKARRPVETSSRYLKENSELRQRVIDAENKLAALERTQMQKRLSPEEKRYLVDALKPFSGQKISIASVRGDDEGRVLAQDFVSVFETAGWDHHGDAGVTQQDWDRDPVGIEVALNETDARADKIAPGVAALINAVRALGLVYDNTVFMDEEVPAGQALVKVGKKLRK